MLTTVVHVKISKEGEQTRKEAAAFIEDNKGVFDEPDD